MINLQSPGPVGLGELLNLPDGNSILTLKNRDGRSVDFKLWINDFTTDLNMEIDTTQLKAGLSYRPIRIQERILTFTTIWSLANRPKYEALVEAIREHWAYNLNELIPTPARFTYFGANKTFQGFILNASRSYAVPDTLLSYSFDMKLMNMRVNEYSSQVSVYSYYVPRPDNIQINGIDGWYAVTDLLDETKKKVEITVYDNLVEQREGGVKPYVGPYTPPDFPAYTDIVNGADSPLRRLRDLAACSLYAIYTQNPAIDEEQAVELVRKYLEHLETGIAENNWNRYQYQMTPEDWEYYHEMADRNGLG